MYKRQASFFVYVINFFPAMLLLLLVDELLLNNVKETGLYLWGSILVLAVMWILLRIEYDALYNTTYQESANLRTEIADMLTKLPLSYSVSYTHLDVYKRQVSVH